MLDIFHQLQADLFAMNVLLGHFVHSKVCQKLSIVLVVIIVRAGPYFRKPVRLEHITLKYRSLVRLTAWTVQLEIIVRLVGCTNQYYVRTDIFATKLVSAIHLTQMPQHISVHQEVSVTRTRTVHIRTSVRPEVTIPVLMDIRAVTVLNVPLDLHACNLESIPKQI